MNWLDSAWIKAHLTVFDKIFPLPALFVRYIGKESEQCSKLLSFLKGLITFSLKYITLYPKHNVLNIPTLLPVVILSWYDIIESQFVEHTIESLDAKL